jgi:hypothetical protein
MEFRTQDFRSDTGPTATPAASDGPPARTFNLVPTTEAES